MLSIINQSSMHRTLTSTQGSSASGSDQGYSPSGHRHHIEQKLSSTTEKLKAEKLRRIKAENDLLQVIDRFNRAVQEAEKARNELRLYKLQLDNARHEILRAQNMLNEVEKQRHDAEKEAMKAKAEARALKQSILIKEAMEDGRRIGMREGLEQGRMLALEDIGEFDEENDTPEQVYGDDEPLVYVDAEYRPQSLLITSNEDVPRSEPGVTALGPDSALVSENIQPIIRPVPFRTPSPSVHHLPVAMPPDGYIPDLDADNVIRIPPPHELSRFPPTPERMNLSPLPQVQEDILSPKQSYLGHRRRSSRASSFAQTEAAIVSAAQHSGRRSPSVSTSHSEQARSATERYSSRQSISRRSSAHSDTSNSRPPNTITGRGSSSGYYS